jgi:REP element-mobilizing transposase RayT
MSDIIGIHWTVTTHGTWLHGDPHGSWKDGRLIEPNPLLLQSMEASMTSDAEKLSFDEIELAADAFGTVCLRGGHRVLAATVRPIHCHLVFAPLTTSIDRVVGWLKRQSASAVFAARRSRGSLTPRHLWTERRFVTFMTEEDHLLNTIEYVRRHNLETGLPADPYSWIDPITADDL